MLRTARDVQIFIGNESSVVKNITCPYCSSNKCQKDYDLTWKDERFPKYSVASCDGCSNGFVLPLPTEEELTELYNSMAYHDADRKAGNFWEFSEQQIAERIASDNCFIGKYARFLPFKGHVLDIGAGWGTLLKAFSNAGYETTGLELSTSCVTFANEKLGLNVFNMPIEKLSELPSGNFDIVTMKHVLEHFYDPKDVLQNLHQRMSESGRLIIEVPDYGSYDRRAYAEQWPAFGPYHLWYFTEPGLRRVLSDCGFEVIEFKTFLSERIFGGKSSIQKFARKVVNKLNAKKIFSGRSIGLIAKKATN